jgi:hypothetical protein
MLTSIPNDNRLLWGMRLCGYRQCGQSKDGEDRELHGYTSYLIILDNVGSNLGDFVVSKLR